MPITAARNVEFPAFRQYESTRQEANNAMMALLAGSKIASHSLQLTKGSQLLLPDIFPDVEHIEYFRLRTDHATAVLAETGRHLGAVAVPYALAVHEDFMMTVLEMVVGLGFVKRAPGRDLDLRRNAVKAWNMHEALEQTLAGDGTVGSTPATSADRELFHLLREMRNSLIHAGGEVSPRLSKCVQSMSEDAVAQCHRLTKRTPSEVIKSGTVCFTTFDIFTAFAVTKALGRQVNKNLLDTLSRPQWASIAVGDYAHSTAKHPKTDAWMRGLRGLADMNYGAVGLANQELVDEAVAAGYWSEGRVALPRRAARRPNGTGST